MERYVKKLPKEQEALNEVLEHIYRNSLGNVVIADSTPTEATLKVGLTYYNNELFFKLVTGKAFKITLTAI
jgi:hypothetical protein